MGIYAFFVVRYCANPEHAFSSQDFFLGAAVTESGIHHLHLQIPFFLGHLGRWSRVVY